MSEFEIYSEDIDDQRAAPHHYACPACPVDEITPGFCNVCGRELIRMAGA
jgi:rRNA maturation endonuclease Nob1